MIRLIMAGVMIWGIIHAIGAVYFELGFWQVMKAIVVYSCILLFLGFWLLMLMHRQRQSKDSTNAEQVG